MRKLLLLALIASATNLLAARHVIDQKTFDAFAHELSGERAQELDRRIVEYHRIQGSPMMASVASDVVLPALKAAGLEASLEQFASDGRTTYQSYVSPIGWNMRGGELWVECETPVRLCRYSDVPMCVSTYSKGGEWSGELIDVGNGTREDDYKNKNVRGKVVLASGYARDVARLAVLEYGAAGTVIYPPADDRPEHPDMVRYNGLWTRAADVAKSSGSFQISANQYAMLRERMSKGAVRVRGNIDADLGPGQLTLVHAWIRGSEADEVILTAHLDHPKWSANDNASGSAAMVEIARTMQSLIARGVVAKPRKTIHFIWVPEYFGTVAYLDKHPEVRACHSFDDPRPKPAASQGCVVANLNLDMVGEDTVKTNGRFYMTRAPLSVPSFLDALLPDILEQTREARLFAPNGTRNYWPAEMIDYYQGSDHDLFLGIGVPASMFGHDPDWTHHTSEDTPDKTDASEFLRVSVIAANAAYWIAGANDDQHAALQPYIEAEESRRGWAMRLNTPEANAARPKSPLLGGSVYHRLTIPPLFGEILAGTPLEKENDLAVFETINFLDGQKPAPQIAMLLTREFGKLYDATWVERVLAQLEAMKLVAK